MSLTEDDLFVAEIAAALAASGRSVDVDQDARTIDVGPAAGAGQDDARVLALVRPHVRGVTLYAVHPRAVPAAALEAVGELANRATADLFAAALELDLTTGSVSARHAVLLAGVEVPDDALGELIGAALDEVEAAAARYAGPVDAVMAGTSTAAEAAADARRAPVEELSPPAS